MKQSIWRHTLLGLSFIAGSTLPATAQEPDPIVASYYSSTGSPDKVAAIPAEKLSHVLYAFLTLCGDHRTAGEIAAARVTKACQGKPDFTATLIGGPSETAELAAFETLKENHPHLKVLASFGGWTLSAPFRDMAKTDAGRRHFVRTAIDVIKNNHAFDGIDIDWEYPGGGDNSSAPLGPEAAATERYVFRAMMRELRIGLDRLSVKTGRTYSLSAAVSGAARQTASIDWAGTAPHMNMVFAMTYDFAVSDGTAAHHTNLYPVPGKTALSGAQMIDNLQTAGVPNRKLVLGAAFYGRGWN
ncbi:MAG: glycosyl hydrolase family 18 protein, partial [Pseudomonadota bacterium]